LDGVISGEIDRLAIHMPPRHGKSETVTVRFVLRWLELNPGKNALVTGYNERFARKFSRRIRNMAKERGMVSADKSAADEWETRSGGLVMARGVGNPPTGTGFGLIVVDDPIRRREDAESAVYREKVWDWYTDDLYSRLEPQGALVLVMTLWHEDDLGARATASEPFHVLKLPAISEAGEALWPERYPVKALERIRNVMVQNQGRRGWEALYQQNPTPRAGTFFQVDRLQVVPAAPIGLPSCLAFDNAASEGEGDWTAGPLVSGPDAQGLWYVEPWRIQKEPSQRNLAMRQRADLKRPTYVTVPKDPAAAGKEVAQNHLKLFAGYAVTAVARRKGEVKQLVAEPFAAQVNAGNVRVVKGPGDEYFAGNERRSFAADYIEELRNFPLGKHDDQVDGSADGFNRLNASSPYIHEETATESYSGGGFDPYSYRS
jgi:phage terminase large subunit-like protein